MAGIDSLYAGNDYPEPEVVQQDPWFSTDDDLYLTPSSIVLAVIGMPLSLLEDALKLRQQNLGANNLLPQHALTLEALSKHHLANRPFGSFQTEEKFWLSDGHHGSIIVHPDGGNYLVKVTVDRFLKPNVYTATAKPDFQETYELILDKRGKLQPFPTHRQITYTEVRDKVEPKVKPKPNLVVVRDETDLRATIKQELAVAEAAKESKDVFKRDFHGYEAENVLKTVINPVLSKWAQALSLQVPKSNLQR